MDIVSLLKNLKLDATLESLSAQHNISSEQVSSISASLFPIITNSLQRALTDSNLMGSLVNLGSQIDLNSIEENVSNLGSTDNQNLGSNLLSTILGGEGRLSEVIGSISKETGVSQQSLSGFLPSLSTLIVGAFLNNSGGLSSLVSSIFASANTGDSTDSPLQNILGMANKFMDQDGNGAGLDDLMALKNKFLG